MLLGEDEAEVEPDVVLPQLDQRRALHAPPVAGLPRRETAGAGGVACSWATRSGLPSFVALNVIFFPLLLERRQRVIIVVAYRPAA